ncbi:DUF47 domain-containing protein [Clostridium gasigenes]|uniref:TIGR00153 family protein n=1 Tax=Clostridium gasigenes TaxID=94869 RepID=A0A1H0UX49_9CLOT|nr:DUF47 family protein [Clostridium gasigenes]MBB6624070.1 DUF47 domain-containing protein [Clostridium gasigenes]MBU3088309.1 DUF47 family protein [Clostridium gasigenes]NKF07618.1 DUF47 domain-containing protein [Clostridium gasigenes]QSW18046.1 DUF47 domain-containing protein [Clostridium gasigenes]SDP70730.1 hypothetical protein SAMN04488529_11323 [Clostridium gasigenes]
MISVKRKEDKFFDMFVDFSKKVHKSALMMRDFMNDTSNTEVKYQEIKDLEKQCDEMLHSIYTELDNSFITPIDREDIHAIGNALDDIIDYIETTSSRILIFDIKETRGYINEFCDLIVEATSEVINLMVEFKIMKKSKILQEKIWLINKLEDAGDKLYRDSLKQLFKETDAIEIIKWKEILERMEKAIDSCEDVANMVKGVVMKNA